MTEDQASERRDRRRVAPATDLTATHPASRAGSGDDAESAAPGSASPGATDAEEPDADDTDAEESDAEEPSADGAASRSWIANLRIERLLATGMFGCIAWALSQTLRAVGARPSLALAIFLVATIAFGIGVAAGGRAGGRNYRKYTEYGVTDWLLLLVPILLFMRLLPSILEGPGALVQDVASWMDNPWRFWNASVAWSLILIFFIWDTSLSVAENLGALAFQPGESAPVAAARIFRPSESAPAAAAPTFHEWVTTPYRFADHTGAWRILMRLFVAGGALVLLLTGLSLVRPEDIGNPNRPEVTGALPVVLLYFLLGLIFASQTSLDRLRADWLRGGVAIQPGLARRWLGYSIALMALGLSLALLLPTTFSDQAADQLPLAWRWLWFLGAPLGFVLRGMEWLLAGLAALLFAPFSLLFPRGSQGAAPPVAVPPVVIPTPSPVEPAGGGFPSLASRVTWILLLYVLPGALALYAIWNTWRKRRVIWQELQTFWRDVYRLLRDSFLDLAATLWRFFSFGSPRILGLAPQAILDRLRRRRAPRRGGSERRGWLRLRGLGPRELIQYFYLSLIQRAEGVGWTRGKGQTPYEYSRDLAERIPDRREEVQ
ncbi:MAG: hypothetical protein M3442_06255, partial [Chloroflexota bacterium]|nr:hypothetical protein [Chloroflexota bacterium]